jgi:hypothetical protein
MGRDINLDITYDSDAICLWVVYQGPQTHLAALLAPLLQAATSPPLVSSLVQQFNCFHELIEFYAQQKGYQQYSSQPYTLKNCLVNATGLLLLPSVVPLMEVPAECGISLIHFGGRIGDRAPSFTVFPWRSAEYVLRPSHCCCFCVLKLHPSHCCCFFVLNNAAAAGTCCTQTAAGTIPTLKPELKAGLPPFSPTRRRAACARAHT